MSQSPEDYRKSPIFKTDFSKPLSGVIEDIRNKIAAVRGNITDVQYGYPQWKERVHHVEGLLTCALVTLAASNEEIMAWEVKCADKERGPSLKFNSRGIGMDECPGCFVCGTTKRTPLSNHYLHNISAFVASKEEGEAVKYWFIDVGAKARVRLDFRPTEPDRIQVKVGACSEHLPNLRKLHDLVSHGHGRLRKQDIVDAMVPINAAT